MSWNLHYAASVFRAGRNPVNSSGKIQEHFCYITDREKRGQKKNESKTVR